MKTARSLGVRGTPLANGPNFLTFDIEEWYHANYEGLDTAVFSEKPTQLPRLIDQLLDICERGGFHSTFFVLGSVAERYPTLIRDISSAGHEIASHGYGHLQVYKMTPSEFKEDLLRSCQILQDVTGRPILGFRAPSFSVTRPILPWFYHTLEDCGLRYSSSVFAGKTFLYGIPDFPDRIHIPYLSDDAPTSILEFPIPSLRLLGTSLGVYVRLFPAWFIRRLIRNRNAQGRSLMLYLHPREIDPLQDRLPLPFLTRMIHYWGICDCDRKVSQIVDDARGTLTTLGQFYELFVQRHFTQELN